MHPSKQLILHVFAALMRIARTLSWPVELFTVRVAACYRVENVRRLR